LKVLIAAHGFLPSIGGVSTHVATQAKSFVAKGHSVTIVTLSPGPVDGYGYRVVRNAGPVQLFSLYRNADLIILSNLAVRLFYPLLLLRRPVALQHHSESAFRLSRSWFSMDLIRRDVMSRATHFMTSAYIGRKSGLKRFEITPPYADPHNITPGIARPPAERNRALFVGRTEPEKGLLWLLDRWPIVRKSLGVDELRIVGTGSLDSEIRDRIDRGLTGIEHLGGLDRSATAQEMASCRYLLVPSLWEEPFGAVALEGIAAGALTILSNRGGLPETTGELGFFYEPGDDASFVEALKRARNTFDSHLASSCQRTEWERAVRDHVDRFNPEVDVERIIQAMAPAIAHV